MRYKRLTILALIYFQVSVLALSQNETSINNLKDNLEEPETVSFCKLFNEKEKYLGKLVRTKVVWIYGHAMSSIRDVDDNCKNDTRSAISFDKKSKFFTKATDEKLETLNKEFYNQTEMTVVGRLNKCESRCGHSDMFEYKFVVEYLEETKPIKFKKP